MLVKDFLDITYSPDGFMFWIPFFDSPTNGGNVLFSCKEAIENGFSQLMDREINRVLLGHKTPIIELTRQ